MYKSRKLCLGGLGIPFHSDLFGCWAPIDPCSALAAKEVFFFFEFIWSPETTGKIRTKEFLVIVRILFRKDSVFRRRLAEVEPFNNTTVPCLLSLRIKNNLEDIHVGLTLGETR